MSSVKEVRHRFGMMSDRIRSIRYQRPTDSGVYRGWRVGARPLPPRFFLPLFSLVKSTIYDHRYHEKSVPHVRYRTHLSRFLGRPHICGRSSCLRKMLFMKGIRNPSPPPEKILDTPLPTGPPGTPISCPSLKRWSSTFSNPQNPLDFAPFSSSLYSARETIACGIKTRKGSNEDVQVTQKGEDRRAGPSGCRWGTLIRRGANDSVLGCERALL